MPNLIRSCGSNRNSGKTLHEYDTVLKTLLQHSRNSIIEQVAGTAIARWHNMELPKVEQMRVDLLGESADSELIHIELQSTNDSLMALRMAEYSLRVYRLFGRFAREIVLLVLLFGKAYKRVWSKKVYQL
ncbi:MAG: hypothetical protein ACJ73N_12730 [Bryobacteraceae bacterium]